MNYSLFEDQLKNTQSKNHRSHGSLQVSLSLSDYLASAFKALIEP